MKLKQLINLWPNLKYWIHKCDVSGLTSFTKYRVSQISIIGPSHTPPLPLHLSISLFTLVIYISSLWILYSSFKQKRIKSFFSFPIISQKKIQFVRGNIENIFLMLYQLKHVCGNMKKEIVWKSPALGVKKSQNPNGSEGKSMFEAFNGI